MRFRVLGPLEVEADGDPVVLRGQKERLLLAQLLTRPNQVVPVEALVLGLWGEHPPPSAAKTLQSHVVRLRRALEPGRARRAPGEVLVTREPGYLLRVAPGALDATRFEELTAAGRRTLGGGSIEVAGSLLREALGLWRGRAFEEFLDADFGAAESDRLAELRLVAVEDRVEADLRLGRHRELVAELEGLVREQPLRERLWAQLLLALYRSGRQADALLAYQRARSILVEELGIDPGADLRRLQAAVLAQDPGLDLPRPTETAAAEELPEALQAVGPVFVGRSAELAWLRAAWTRATHGQGGVVFLAGKRGIGKTRLAAELAREVHGQGERVLYGRCTAATSDPLQPLGQALAGIGASLQDVAGPDRSSAALGQGLADLLAGRSDHPVLLVLDDLHLAQAPTVEAVAGLGATATSRRLLVLSAYDDEAATAGLAGLVERLDPDGTGRRRLGPLNRDEVTNVLAIYGAQTPAREAATDPLLERTDGVPLLVHQAASDWAQAQAAQQVQETAKQIASSRSSLRVNNAKFADDLVGLRELGEHTQQIARLATGQSPEDKEPEDRPAAAVCPYKGLARFEPSDAEFFFGRERLVAELVTQLVGAGLVGVVGPSGSGKSSLVRAGLLPALADGVLPGSDRWRQLLVRPGEHPMAELARAGARPDLPDGGGDATAAKRNADGTMPWEEAGRRGLRTMAGEGRLLLVVDQFEEVFTTCRDQEERAAFLATLTEAAWADRSVNVVVVVRADYYGHCAADSRLAGLLAANQVLVGPMDADELRRAVELPARRAGLRLEPGLSAAMIGEVAEEPGGLPLLSCALLEGWQQRRGRTMTLAAYHWAGGVRGAVARLAERAWQQLDSDQQVVARRVLLRLAGPGEGEAVVRRRVPLREFAGGGDAHARVVLDTLADQRLLTKSEDSVEVAHEALLREWPRLRGWLEEDVHGRALHRHLIGAAREWEAAGRDPGELYRGARLTGALDWAHEHRADLNELERAFLDDSRATAEREVADARRRAEREARTSRRLRGLVAGLAAVLALALAAGGFALALRGRAERQTLVAQRQTQVAESRRLAAQVLLQDDLDRSLLLAIEAMRLDDSVDTRSALLTTLLRSPQALRVFHGDGNQLHHLTASRDGRTLAAMNNAGDTYLWDIRRGRLHGPSGFGLVAFGRDGRLLATLGVTFDRPPSLLLWDVAHRRIAKWLPLLSKHEDVLDVVDAAFSPDGRILAASTLRGSLIFWDVASGARLGRTQPHSGLAPPRREGFEGILAFGPDGTLYMSAQGGKTIVWDVARRRRVRTIPLGGTLAVSRDGRTVALGQQDGSIILADAGTGRRRRVLTAHGAAVTRLAFSPASDILASVSDDRTAILWNLATGKARETLRGHAGSVTGVAFSPDGATLYTSSLDDSVIAWDLTGTRGLAQQLTHVASPVVGIAFSRRDPNLLAVAHRDGPVTLWNVARRVRVGNPLDVTSGSANAVAFSPDGSLLAAADADGTVVLFDVASHARVGRPLRPPYGPIHAPYQSRDVNDIAFSLDGRLLATAGNDGSMVLWDLARRAPIGRPLRPQGVFVGGGGLPLTAVAFSPDGRMLAWGGDDGRVQLTRVPDGLLLHELTATGGRAGLSALAFSPDGKNLATAGIDGKVRLWDPRTGAARGPAWTVGGGPVPSVSFSPDSSVLATSGSEGAATLWDVRSGKRVGAPLTGPTSPGVAAFDPTGHTLATAFHDGTVLLWDVDPASWRKRACAVAGRPLTQQEWQDLLPGRPYRPSCGTR